MVLKDITNLNRLFFYLFICLANKHLDTNVSRENGNISTSSRDFNI